MTDKVGNLVADVLTAVEEDTIMLQVIECRAIYITFLSVRLALSNHLKYARLSSTFVYSRKFQNTASGLIPHQSLVPTRTRAYFPRTRRRVRRRVLVLDQRHKKLPHLPAPRIRRIVVDTEHANGAEASTIDNGRLTGQGAVAVDTRVDTSRENRAVAEKASGGIVDGRVDFRAASHARLDKRRVHAIGVLEGGDLRVIDAEAVAER